MVWTSLILPSWSLSWFHVLHPRVRKLHLSHQPVRSLTAANNKITKFWGDELPSASHCCAIYLCSLGGWLIYIVGQLTALSLSLQEGVEDCRGNLDLSLLWKRSSLQTATSPDTLSRSFSFLLPFPLTFLFSLFLLYLSFSPFPFSRSLFSFQHISSLHNALSPVFGSWINPSYCFPLLAHKRKEKYIHNQ